MKNSVAVSLLAALVVSGSAFAASYTEAGNGDLSGNLNAPTGFNLAVGANTLTATTVAGDEDYVTIVVPDGSNLQSLFLTAYSGAATKSFIAMQKGSVFTETVATPNPANMLGYIHFGTSMTAGGQLGTDIFPAMAQGIAGNPAPIGFTEPLAAGSYTFWLHETGNTAYTYTFTFNIAAAVSAPIITPASGNYDGPLSVTLSSPTAGATVYYTIDGSTPTSASNIYSAPFAITKGTTVKAIGSKAGLADSTLATATYTINAPTITLSGGKSITTTKPKVVIKGKASSDVTKVEYRIGNGAFKPAAGKGSWKITAKLPIGKSVVTIQATGGGGTSKLVKVKVNVKAKK